MYRVFRGLRLSGAETKHRRGAANPKPCSVKLYTVQEALNVSS